MKQADTNAMIASHSFMGNIVFPFAACVPFLALPMANLHAIAFRQAQREVQEQERHARWLRRLEPSLN